MTIRKLPGHFCASALPKVHELSCSGRPWRFPCGWAVFHSKCPPRQYKCQNRAESRGWLVQWSAGLVDLPYKSIASWHPTKMIAWSNQTSALIALSNSLVLCWLGVLEEGIRKIKSSQEVLVSFHIPLDLYFEFVAFPFVVPLELGLGCSISCWGLFTMASDSRLARASSRLRSYCDE